MKRLFDKNDTFVCQDGTILPSKFIVLWDRDGAFIKCWFSVKDAAEDLGVSTCTVYNQLGVGSRSVKRSYKIPGVLTLEETSKFCD